MKVLVTGAAGYIGSVLVGRLLAQGFTILAVDNLQYGQTSLLPYCSHPQFEFVRQDVRNRVEMYSLYAQCDFVLPLAAIVGAKACDEYPEAARLTNFDAIRYLDESKVIYPCSNSGYGAKSKEVYCTEETPLDPLTYYGQMKAWADNTVLRNGGISLRLATVFGPSPRLRLDLLVNDFVARAMTQGFLVLYESHFYRNFVHVEDVADAFIHCINHYEAMKGQAYNVGNTDLNMTKRQLAEKIALHVPCQLFFSDQGSDPDQRNYLVSHQKLADKGFVCRRSLEEGIEGLKKAIRMMPKGTFHNASLSRL